MALLELGLGNDGVQAPEVAGVLDLSFIVLDEEVDRPVTYAAEQESVPAGMLQDRAEVAAAVGIAPAAGLGGLPDGLIATPKQGGAGEEARQQAEDVVWAQCVSAMRDAVEEQAGTQAVATHVAAVRLLQQRLSLDGT